MGHVGYYCAGMNKRATVRVHGNAGTGLAENMMSGTVVVDGNASQAAGATGRGGLLVVHGDAGARCGISMKGIDIVVSRLDRPHERVHGAARLPRRLRRRGRGARRLDLRGAHLTCAARSPRSAPTASRRSCASDHVAELCGAARARRARRSRPVRSSGATARRGGSTTSRSTTPGRTDGRRRRLAARAARVVPVRPQRDRRDPARRARGHLRHPRLRREAAAAALRRPAAARREHLALPARGLPRALRHRRRARHALRAQAARAEDPGHDRRDELRRPLGAGEGGARPGRDRGRDLDDDRRRRHDARRSGRARRRSSTSCCRRATA